MFSESDLKKHLRNIKLFKAYSFPTLFKETISFPLDYYLGNGKSSYPLNIVLLATMRCNLHCEMCKVTEIIERKNKKEASLEEIKTLVKQVAKFKPSFTLSGGEPFLRTDTAEIVKLVKAHGCSIGAFTNGTLLNEKLIKKLVEARLDYIAFSLEGADAKTHNSIVNNNNAFQLLSKNLEFFCKNKHKTSVVISVTISEKNVENLGEIASLGKSIGVDFVRFNHLCFLTKEDQKRNNDFCKKFFPEEEIRATSFALENSGLGTIVEKKVKELKVQFGNYVGFAPELSPEEIKAWYSNNFSSKRKCLFAWRACFIAPNLDIYPCEPFSVPMGNLKERQFMEIWNNEKYQGFRRQLKKGLFPSCARCCKL